MSVAAHVQCIMSVLYYALPTHNQRFCQCVFWFIAAFSKSNLGKVCIIGILKICSLL